MSAQHSTAARRLPKAERRKQLIETALEIVRSEGTDALSLGLLAERAGVSKPIAYDHFTSRSGLLIALYREIDEKQVAAALDALERAPRRLEDVARVLSHAYMNCYTTIGPEWHAVSAALKGTEEMDAFQQELMDEYADIYLKAFRPYTDLSRRKLRTYCIGFLGAAESISREMLRGSISERAASDSLRSLIIGALSRAA